MKYIHITTLFAIILFSNTLYAKEQSFQVGGGAQFNLRLTYNQYIDAGVGSGGAQTWFRYQYKFIFVESAISYETSGIGMQLLFPITIGGTFYKWKKISLDGFGRIYPGIALFWYRPPAIIGAGTGTGFNFQITDHFGLRFYHEIRYLTAPEYSKNIAQYHTVEIPFSAGFYGIW